MICPNCKTKMTLMTQYIGNDGKIERVYKCPECQFIQEA